MNGIGRQWGFGLVFALVLCAICFGIYLASNSFAASSEDASEAATYTVQRRTLEDRVVERGTVESQKTVYGKCQVVNSLSTLLNEFTNGSIRICTF